MRLRATRLSAIAQAARLVVAAIINVFDGVAAAYSVRIPAACPYNGSLQRVRRDSDNAELNIGALILADANGNRWLDEQALTLFCGAPKYPLDAVSGAAAACALRLLRVGYTGPCIRVRRSNDNAEQDIGFTPAGGVDTVALLAFVGANSGFVTTWYDQSGNGRNATQTIPANQPRIVNAGVIDTYAGSSRPSLRATANGQCFVIPSYIGTLMTIGTGSHVWAETATRDFSTPSFFSAGNEGSQVVGWHGDTVASNSAIGNFSNTLFRLGTHHSNGNPYTIAAPAGVGDKPTSATIHTFNPTSPSTASAPVFSASLMGDSRPTTSSRWVDAIWEVILFQTVLPETQRQALERSQAAYYGITYATPIPSGFVTTWYDQSGNGRHATQSTAALQPRIVNAGALDTRNGRPAVVSPDNQTRLTGTLNVNGLSTLALNVVGGSPHTGLVQDGQPAYFSWSEVGSWGQVFMATNQTSIGWRFGTGQSGNNRSANAAFGSALNVITVQKAGAIETPHRNGVALAPFTGAQTTLQNNSSDFNLLGSPSGTSADGLAMCEATIFTTAFAGRASLEASQGAAFGIAVA